MKHTKLFLPIAAIAVIIIAGVWIMLNFSSQATDYITDLSIKRLEEYTQHDAMGTREDIKDALYLVRSVAAAFSSADSLHRADSVRRLREICLNTSFKDIWIADMNGMCVDTFGTAHDISSRPYFKRMLLGECIVTDEPESDNKGKFIIVSAPIIKDGKTAGAVYGEFPIFNLAYAINTESFDGDSYTIMITPDGKYVAQAINGNVLNRKQENFWQFIKHASFNKGYSYKQFYDDVTLGKCGMLQCKLNGQTRTAYYTPVGINNWYLIKVVTQGSIMRSTDSLKKLVWPLIIKISALLLLIWLLVIWHLNKLENARVRSAIKFRSLVDNIPGGVAEVIVSDSMTIKFANDGFYLLSGYKRDDPRSLPFHFSSEDEKKQTLKCIKEELREKGTVHAEYQIRRQDGALRWIAISGTAIYYCEDGAAVQAIFLDITQDKERTEQLLENAKHDKMTLLYEKTSVQEIIGRRLSNIAQDTFDVLAVMDIDKFKHINDTFGHDVGDKVIINVAAAMKSFFRESDICGRIGGDEFIIFMPKIKDLESASHRLEKFLKVINSIETADQKGLVMCSIGAAAIAASDGMTYSAAFKAADQNLYTAKRRGGGHVVLSRGSEEV